MIIIHIYKKCYSIEINVVNAKFSEKIDECYYHSAFSHQLFFQTVTSSPGRLSYFMAYQPLQDI